MADITTIREAIAGLLRDGDVVAMEGFTHLIPFAAGTKSSVSGGDLTLVRMTRRHYDQLIGGGCAKKLIFSRGGNPGGIAAPPRDAVEHDWLAALRFRSTGMGIFERLCGWRVEAALRGATRMRARICPNTMIRSSLSIARSREKPLLR